MTKIAYTVFHPKSDLGQNLERSENVQAIKNCFKNLDYIDTDVVMINNLKDYNNARNKISDLKNIKIKGSMRFGAVGLLFTTFLAYKKMKDLEYDIFVFFEDDAKIIDKNINLFFKYLNDLPKNFDVFSMYDDKAFYKNYNNKHDFNDSDICFCYNDKSTLVYAISKTGIKKYFKYMMKLIDAPIDLFLFDEKKDTFKYAIKPSSEQIFYSDYFVDNGDPDYDHSFINKTEEFFFKK